ncbi:gfo/Idh/MocA family oxidoreductase [Streptomyces tateyamensis]|uniref:Gfo/Idh/MocA family oxidoreductase n=1 Tax=Streptomyces tateyamensis TaxID=565073 RepID=A0A2V4NF21_9ACTN|nr:Gfo/Idh/MocA family oxidoreductase [Streptomyces tateyamensis]PYC80519.1 gfo/Idh/MocA family oxidoreductase [Streptomyces tateyamensis]
MNHPPRPVAVIGLGVISRFYLAAIEADPGFELAAVCDLSAAALADGPPVPGYRDHRALLAAHPELAAAVVTAPNDAHYPLCRDLLAAGLPVCVEKPLATDPADAQRLAALAAGRGTVLFTAFHRRYNHPLRELLARLDQPVRQLTVRYFEQIEEHIGQDRWYLDPARCGGGCVADNGPNAFDLVRLVLAGAEPAVVRATVERDAAGLDRRAVVELATDEAPPRRARVELDWSYPGELKDVSITLADGSVHRADLLAGCPGFKESLWHEYRGILAAFGAALDRPGGHRDGGQAALDLVHAAYRLAGEQATHVAIRIPEEVR